VSQALARRPEVEPLDGEFREHGRLRFKQVHARRRAGKMPAPVKIDGRKWASGLVGVGIEIGVAMLDGRSFGHPAEELRPALVSLEQRMAELHEGLMHIMGRQGGRDLIDVRFCHHRD